MKLLFVAIGCALFFGAAITALHLRLWPDSPLGLLILSALSVFISTIIGARLTSSSPGPIALTDSKPSPKRRSDKQPRADKPARADSRPAQSRPARQGNNTSGADADSANAGAASDYANQPREEGEVKWFNRTKGFGFIIRSNGEEIFVHQRAIRQIDADDNRRRPILRDGQRVSFIVVERDRGQQAEDVVDSEAAA